MTLPIAYLHLRQKPHSAKFWLGVVAVALLLTGISSPAGAEEYLLGPQDKIRLKVYEWRASRDDIFEWKAMNDEFTVGPDGMVSLPFAGAVRAEGRTAIELGEQIGERLKDRMQLINAPDTSVEIIGFRPVYVVGAVAQPGQFPYAPNMTVLQAMTLAGGLRDREDGVTGMVRDMLSEKGDVDVIGLNALSLLARKARLEAEHAGADHIQFPPELTSRADSGPAVEVMRQEEAIFKARREGLENQTKALESLRQTLSDELGSLQGQLGFHDKQISLIEKELTGVSSLVDKGIVAAPRQISLERELAQFQSTRLAAETSLLRSRQEISRTDISILDLKNRYDNEVVVSLRDTQSQLDELASKMKTATALLQSSSMAVPKLLAMRAAGERPEPIFTIVRPGKDGKETEITAEEGTALAPGDTVKVDIKPIFGAGDFDLSLIGSNNSPGQSKKAGSGLADAASTQ
ncbi:MAG: polysaccharide biosynthesis/export family protein [Rhizobiales bacterium]|nr:polysaccharide biosynthesis/export family protein [Hyphomicrobiales bacterium]